MANLTDIPWFAELWHKQLPQLLERRELCFSSQGETVILCGIDCKELSLQAMTDLLLCDNKLINGGQVEHADCAAFVWRLSPHYVPKNVLTHWIQRKRFLRHFRRTPEWLAVDECRTYIETVFENVAFVGQTQADKKKKNALPIASYASSLVDQIASEYGWSESIIMQIPIKRLLQYTRRIAQRKLPDYEAPIPFDKARAQALKEINAQKKTRTKR